jgi:hypothetical protein
MSLNVTPLPVKAVLDPRLDIVAQKDYIAVKGAEVNNFQTFNATNINNSSFQITANPPNAGIVISRLVLKRVSFQWQITGVNTSGGTLLNAGFIGPRCMPLTCCTQSEGVSINNDTITVSPLSQFARSLLHYRNSHDDRFGPLSLAPSMLDQFQDYADGAGSVRNPLAAYGDNSYEQTRGSYVGFTIDPQVPGNTVATGSLETYEPIMMSPFVWGERANYYSGFAGITNMAYTATLGDLSRILSIQQGQGAPPGQIVLGAPVVNVVAASLLFNFLTPPAVMPVPRNIETSFFSLVSYPTRSLVPVAPGGQIQLTLSSIQIASIPKRVYIFAKRDDSQETAFTSDTYLSIATGVNPLTITWNNNQLLSTSTTADLYNIAVKNGCNQSWTQWTSRTGSVLALDFGTDLGLPSDQSPGSLGSYQFSLTCAFTNTSTQAVLPTLYAVIVSEGVFSIRDQSASHMLGVLSASDVLNAEMLPSGSYRRSDDIYGGKFEAIKHFFQKAGKFIKDHKLVSRGLSLIPDPRAQMASRAASALGFGMSGGSVDDYGGSLAVGQVRGLDHDDAPAPRPRGRPKKAISADKAKSGMNLSDLA